MCVATAEMLACWRWRLTTPVDTKACCVPVKSHHHLSDHLQTLTAVRVGKTNIQTPGDKDVYFIEEMDMPISECMAVFVAELKGFANLHTLDIRIHNAVVIYCQETCGMMSHRAPATCISARF